MATKKKAAKKPVKKTAKKTAKKVVKKKAAPKKQKELKSGASYGCTKCGLLVTVDETCGCVDFCDIICCGEQMKPAR
jgi:hypothetical protein